MSSIHFSEQTGKSYYYNSIEGFLNDTPNSIIGVLTRSSAADAFAIDVEQLNAWRNQIQQLQDKLSAMVASGIVIHTAR